MKKTYQQLKNDEDGSSLKLQTVFPPDSDTSWASIYTGMNPAEHGVLQFIDPLEKAHKYLSEEIDNTTIRGKAYWDVAGKYGKKSVYYYHTSVTLFGLLMV